ncbi:MAG: transcription-repair coupling factor [Candidatus Margulisbacteria bacterium]|jgi:transcription-repair coupling factor (superfamily II helicase)|nr:transcription-repair coupling factor [Candidatus Margulisiibacteriota bacterium]
MRLAELTAEIARSISLPAQRAFTGLPGASRAAVIAALAEKEKNLVVITASGIKAERLAQECALFSARHPVIFPALDSLPDDTILPSKELIGERLRVVAGWARHEAQLVITTLKAVGQKTVGETDNLDLRLGGSVGLENLIGKLINLGYKRFDIVGERGEFSVRGGIIDLYPINQPAAVRLELAADQIASLRQFDPYSQRSTRLINDCLVLPARENGKNSLLEIAPAGTLIILDEPAELPDHAQFNDRQPIILSSFLGADETPLFAAAPDHRDRLSQVPAAALVVSRHAPRLREELPEHYVVAGELRGGFVFHDRLVLTDRELFGEELGRPPVKAKVKEGVADFLLADLKPGDYVVHENYGIGLFRGLEQLAIDEIRQEYLLIEYAGEDKLYVPPAMAGLVEKYNGGREAHPRLSRLGSKEWLRIRKNVKESVKEMTRELLQIYAARQKLEGKAFPPDDVWQKELEATFPYEETADQLKAIAAVKQDMESPRPMDRLVCGDVGYGKTEVAVRAAAKAAAAGKQVAVLAPTTILAEQHYNTFRERFRNLPYVVEMLSRFRSPAEQKSVVSALAAGGVDVVIGTHRLFSKDIKFRDLGLLIVDEEQKFGVSHKEKMKKLRTTVDVLTLTATPIPRTLYFSLAGIREFSLIATPPVDRSPIRTHILPYNETVIAEAIRREIDRGGQVYFLHNYVESIAGVAAKLARLVPEARIAVGHGQMDEKTLEKTMQGFMEKKTDVLVCTSIIESGLDITNVNTILVDQADRLGLSQLYQIRGRVGRSAVRAYAYLFYHPARSMSDQAVERLKAIQEFTALGSGYKLAMRDLEIRGAGNLLGAAQSGHIYEVGFDLYCELLEEAVKELKGETVVAPREVEIDLRVAASIPADYVTDDRQRIALYRRLNLIIEPAGASDLKKELLDRFGPLPPQLETLLRIVELKAEALKRGVKSIKERDGQIRIDWLSKKFVYLAVGGRDPIRLARLGIAG